MQGAATQAMCDIVEERQPRGCLPSDASLRAAAPLTGKPLRFAGYDSIGNGNGSKMPNYSCASLWRNGRTRADHTHRAPTSSLMSSTQWERQYSSRPSAICCEAEGL